MTQRHSSNLRQRICRRGTGALLLALLCVVPPCTAADAPAVAGTAPAAAQSQDLANLIDTAVALSRQGKYGAAYELVSKVVHDPVFAQVPQSGQHSILQFAAALAAEASDALSAHELFSASTRFPQSEARDWAGRFVSALTIDDSVDAATSLLTLVRRWPAELKNYRPDSLERVVLALEEPAQKTLRTELLEALFAAGWRSNFNAEPEELWRELALKLLEIGQQDRARAVSDRISGAESLARMRIDRRFTPLVSADPARFDIGRALAADIERARVVVRQNRRSLDAVARLCYLLGQAGRWNELLAATDTALQRIRKNPRSFDDAENLHGWVMNLQAWALSSLGRSTEALRLMEAARRIGRADHDNIDQAINLGALNLRLQQPAAALRSVEGIDWSKGISDYGRMQLQAVRHAALRRLGRIEEATEALDYLREHRKIAETTYLESLLDAGKIDEAAATLTAQLQDPAKRDAALWSVQQFAVAPLAPRDTPYLQAREQMLARADVQTAITVAGERQSLPIYEF